MARRVCNQRSSREFNKRKREEEREEILFELSGDENTDEENERIKKKYKERVGVGWGDDLTSSTVCTMLLLFLF